MGTKEELELLLGRKFKKNWTKDSSSINLLNCVYGSSDRRFSSNCRAREESRNQIQSTIDKTKLNLCSAENIFEMTGKSWKSKNFISKVIRGGESGINENSHILKSFEKARFSESDSWIKAKSGIKRSKASFSKEEFNEEDSDDTINNGEQYNDDDNEYPYKRKRKMGQHPTITRVFLLFIFTQNKYITAKNLPSIIRKGIRKLAEQNCKRPPHSKRPPLRNQTFIHSLNARMLPRPKKTTPTNKQTQTQNLLPFRKAQFPNTFLGHIYRRKFPYFLPNIRKRRRNQRGAAHQARQLDYIHKGQPI